MVSFGTPGFVGIESGNAPMVFAKPADLKNGDILLLVLRAQESNSFLPFQVPSGFVEITNPATQPLIASRRIAGIFAKKVTDASAEAASFTVTSTKVRRVGAIIPMRTDMEGDLVIVGRGAYGGDSLGSGIATLVARTNAGDKAISLVLMGSENVAGVSHVPSSKPAGYTELFNVQHTLNSVTSGSRTAIWFGYKELPTNSFPQTSGGWSGGAGYAIYESSISGGGTHVDTHPGYTIETEDGAALLTVINAEGEEVVPTALQTWYPGFSSVDEMVNTHGATWAHRGGSVNWPEMSEWAYDQSVMRGYGALEFSAARTTDPWWFGLHDETTDRTSGGTFGKASLQTRAQIEAQQIVIGASGAPRPYFGLLEFIQKYGETHVLIFDYKYARNFGPEFLNLIADNMDVDRAIYKSFGPGTNNNAALARQMGIKSWGFFYQEDYDDGDLASFQAQYDFLGMDLTATTAWTGPNNVLSYGKPVVGHIASSQGQYDLAMSKGSQMVQCSNVGGIKPVGAFA